MSLRVWLPMNRDLRNQGLDDVTVTNNGATFNSAGKLGGCYSFNASGYLKETSFDWSNFNTSEFSLCCWYKEPSPVASGNSQMICIGTSSGWNNIRIGLLRRTSNGYPMFSVSDGTNNVNYNFTADSFTLDTWNHIVCTYNNGTMKMYLNGVLHKTSTTTITPVLNSSQHLGVGAASNGSEPLTGSLNDVRIYDHCLSPMEVKELSKGLVLHYPLNRQGWGQENLLPGSYKADGNTTNKIYGWQANGFGAPEIIKVDNVDCIHLQASCTGKYIPSIVSASKVFLEYGIEYTISCDLKFDKDITVTNSTPIHYHSGSSDTTNEFNLTNANNGHGFNFKSISPAANTIVPANTWQHYEQHIVAKSSATDSSLPYLTYRAFIYGSNRTTSETTTVNMWLKNWKIEKGSIATPWCPNSSDALATTMGLNSTTEYDCSGFCNNGTRTGTFNWTSDTPKYSVSTKFDNNRIMDNTTVLLSQQNHISLAAWVKLTSYTSDRCMIALINQFYLTVNSSGQLSGYAYGKNPEGYHNSNSTIPLNTWTHVAIIWDDSTIKFYINGQLDKSITSTGVSSTTNYQIRIGQENANRQVKGNLSDVRVYVTALSANDVKSLYQNSAYIDSNGNVYGAVHSEV